MTRPCFKYLCAKIDENDDRDEFKSKDYLCALRNGDSGNKGETAKMNNAHKQSTGGFLSGKMQVALTLRFLAGGSYLDLAFLFQAGPSTVYETFHSVIKNWILDDRLVKSNGLDYLSDKKMMKN